MNNQQQLEPRKGKFVFIGIILILLIIGVSVSWFLIIKPAMTPTAPVTPAAPASPEIIQGNLAINDLKFCSDIDEAYACTEQPNAEFAQGSKIYILMTIAGYQKEMQGDGNYYKYFAQSIKTTDSNGNVVPELTGNNVVIVDRTEQALPEEIIPIMNSWVLPLSYEKGKYTVQIDINDRISGKSASKTAVFKLV